MPTKTPKAQVSPKPGKSIVARSSSSKSVQVAEKKAKTNKTPKPLTTTQRLDAIGIDAICERIEGGESQASIATSVGVDKGDFCRWIAADSQRSARARESRVVSAQHWDDQAEQVLIAADVTNSGAIAKARELASHYRWRASKRAPKEYGDKLDLTHSGKIELTDAQVQTRLLLLIEKTKVGNDGDNVDESTS